MGEPTTFTPGNFAAASTLQRTDRIPAALAYLHDEVQSFLAASLTDDGGEAAVSARRRTLHEYRARVHRRILQLDGALEVRGLVDRRGKLRLPWLQQLGALIEKAVAIDKTLGLTRRQKRVSLDEYIAEKYGRKEAEP